MSRIRLLDCSKLAINWKNDNDVTICWNGIIVIYWSKFHVSIVTGSRCMTIFLYKGLTRNLEIRNTPIWVLPNIWRLGGVRDTKFGMTVSNEMLLNVAKWQGCIFYRFWIIKVKPTGGNPCPSHPPRLALKEKKDKKVAS